MSKRQPSTTTVYAPLKFKVLGRTLEHFGVQMYKRREVAIAELVANCWDAGATEVIIDLPDPSKYNPDTSRIVIRDTGCGMDRDEVQDSYLVLGRNRRREGGIEVQTCLPLDFGEKQKKGKQNPEAIQKTRRVMGRKGIGKLAGFGLARKMTVSTWRAKEGLEFYLDLTELKAEDNTSEDKPIHWKPIPPRKQLSTSGTVVTLEALKHKTPMNVDSLRRSLARRLSRTVKGQMKITVNGHELPDPTPPLDFRLPSQNSGRHVEEIKLTDGSTVRYWYGFATDVIHDRELRGFTILVHGKVAQAPPFFFDVEARASGQHATRYVIGEIEADFLDNGTDDDTDLVSTDRQEIDWEDEKAQLLKVWGEELSKKTLRDCTEFRGEKTVKEVLSNPGLDRRIKRLDRPSQKQITQFLRILGNRDSDNGKTLELAGALVRAYEFRQFHDVIEELEEASSDPDKLAAMLQQLNEWKVLESRAILEVVKGRLDILDKFEKMLCNDAPETASSRTPENMHDLLAGNPWLLNPEWQVLAEEKKITTQLRDWGRQDLPDYHGRYDFLALSSERELVLIEIKRPEHPAEWAEISRLFDYQEKLCLGRDLQFNLVFICGKRPNVSEQQMKRLKATPDFEIRYWNELFGRTRCVYEHYRAVLEGTVDEPGFGAKEEEVARTRSLLKHGVHRGPAERARGIPAQDVDYTKKKTSKT